MSSTTQNPTPAQQPIRGRTGTYVSGRQAYPSINHLQAPTIKVGVQRNTRMDFYVQNLVYETLQTNPLFLVNFLQEHEFWLAKYLREFYNCGLPAPKGHVVSLSASDHASNAVPTSCKPDIVPQVSSRTNSAAPISHSVSAPCKPENVPQASTRSIQNHRAPASASTAQRSSNYQRPTVENVASYDLPQNERGDSPTSTSSQPSAWPTEEDLSVPYPTPDEKLRSEADLMRGSGNKWTFEEQDLAIGFMYQIRDDPTVPKTEERFNEVSRRMKQEYGYERSKNSVKNMWNRIGRHRSRFDERKNKSAPLATSMQGKQARMENQVKRVIKRKEPEEPNEAEPVQKRTKTATPSEPQHSQPALDPALINTVADKSSPGYMKAASSIDLEGWNLQLPPGYPVTEIDHLKPTNLPQGYVHLSDIQPQHGSTQHVAGSNNSCPTNNDQSVQASVIFPTMPGGSDDFSFMHDSEVNLNENFMSEEDFQALLQGTYNDGSDELFI